MLPFIDKVKGFDRDKLPDWGGWGFLKDWETPIVEDTLEQVSERGKKDAEVGLAHLPVAGRCEC